MVEVLVFAAVFSAGLSLALTPIVIRLANIVGAVDKPDERKIHKRPTPRLGGLAAFGSFIITLSAIHFIMPGAKLDDFVQQSSWFTLAVSIFAIVILGICDDIWTLKPGQKFLVQFIAGILVYLAGFRINSITNPFTGGVIYFGMMSFPLTVVWVVGISNAFNLIDGLDGLASGIAVIAGLTIAAIAILHANLTSAIVAIALSGSVLGFLRYNFNPAKVFLGDSGSLFIGFTLAVLSINSSTKGSTAFSVIVSLLALGVPIMDTSLAMLRRILRSFLPDQSLPVSSLRKLHSMFLPDKRHIHHQLLARGYSHRDAVLVLYIVSCACGICAFLVTAGSLNASLILAGIGIGAVIAVRKLGYREMAVIRNGLLLRLYQRAFVKHMISQVLLDVVSVFGAFLFARLLTSNQGSTSTDWRTIAFEMVGICILQLAAFLLGGLYRRSVTLLGLGDLLQMLKAAIGGAIVAAAALWFLPLVRQGSDVAMFVLLDFYFLATFVIGSRVAFHAMNYVFNREVSGGKKAIIYGADTNGMITLQSLLSGKSGPGNGNPQVTPVGFLDDNPNMEGKFLDGYPVFGGHWKLEGLMNRMNISEIVLANPNLSSETFQRVKKIADRHNVTIKVSRMRLEPVGANNHTRKSDRVHRPNRNTLAPKAA